MRFLKDNAMQVSGVLTYVLGLVLTVWHPSAALTAQLASAPSALAQFLIGMKLRNGKTAPVPT